MILYMDALRGVTLGIMFLALAFRGAERRLVRRLESEGATAPDRSVDLASQGGLKRLALKRLVSVGAIKAAGGVKHYLAPEGYAAFRHRRRIRALVILGALLAVMGVMWWRGVG